MLLKQATICKCDLRCRFTAVYIDFIFQGSIQEERARHLQEDLNASREKYEKSQEEVQSVMKVIFAFPSLRSLLFIGCNINSNFNLYRLQRKKRKSEVYKTRFWPRRNNTLKEFNRCESFNRNAIIMS